MTWTANYADHASNCAKPPALLRLQQQAVRVFRLVRGSCGRVAQYRYDPYENTVSSSGTLAAANTYRFSSKKIHVNSGHYCYGYRWYDPSLPRWLNRDPIGERGGINLYAYARNDSINFADPQGLDLWGFLPGNPNGLGSGIGSINNTTTNAYAGNASQGQHGASVAVTVVPGLNGGGTNRPNDMDFIFPTPERPIDCRTNGAFKIGSNQSILRPNPVPRMTNNASMVNYAGYWPPNLSSNLTGYPR
jgi:RHS repeat-associated protein